jgi:hypothetical protein
MMDRDRFDRLKRIVLEAVDLPLPERVAYLAEALSDDPELRSEAESLLSHDLDLSAFGMDPSMGEVRGAPGTAITSSPWSSSVDRS